MLWKWGDQGKQARAYLVGKEIEVRGRQLMRMLKTTSVVWAGANERLIHHLQQIWGLLRK